MKTRRQFLTTTGMSAAATGLALGQIEKGWIDAHVHVWSPDTDKWPLAGNYTKDRMKPPSFTPDELFAHCKPHGVSRIVLIQMSFYGFDNSYMLHAMKTPG